MGTRLDLRKVDVEEFLNELGLNKIRKDGNQYWFSCPLPQHIGEDHTPSISMEIGTTRCYCFGCHFAGNAISFLAELEGISNLKARKFIRERFNIHFQETKAGFKKEVQSKLERMQKDKTEKKELKKTFFLDESEVEKRELDWRIVWTAWMDKQDFAYPFAYMLDRGFSKETLNEWQIGWDDISQTFSIPIRDEEGRLIGFKGRHYEPARKSRYFYLGGDEYGFQTTNATKYLFGLNKAIKSRTYFMNGYELIITEGELNAISMHQKGFEHTVGISGRNLSDYQNDLIKKYSSKAIFRFDDPKDAKIAAKDLSNHIYTSVFPYSDKDPADLSKDELWNLYRRRESVILL